ncbi:MAG: HAMP domain-containing sensor histidine kinase [Rickettsiaceae bacterium]|nr:HAMP domain-containing sensor histidine kinase [Rickettsiaceae bacterium]
MVSFFKARRNFFPSGILARFALIICAPIIVCQLVTIYLFYEKVWFNVTAQTSKMLANEIKLVMSEYSSGDLTNLVQFSQLFNFKFEQVSSLPTFEHETQRAELESFSGVLRKNFANFKLAHHKHGEQNIEIYFYNEGGSYLRLTTHSKPLLNPTAEIFIFWILGISSIFLLVAMVFAKNQIRSIEELSRAANNFGGNASGKIAFKPSGAAEIRKAGIAFLKMQDRLEKQVKKRLQMLALISHDLRTPLTRMILQLELMEETRENKLLKSDLDSMKHMIDSYLDFARGESAEESIRTEMNEYLTKFFELSRFKNTKLILSNKPIYANIRYLSFMRALTNLISNAEKYAKHAELRCFEKEGKIIFSIDDDGLGIDDKEKQLVFKAFYRSDKARNIDKYASVGLGLPIAKEIILSHKGTIIIADSDLLGGAQIIVTIDAA